MGKPSVKLSLKNALVVLPALLTLAGCSTTDSKVQHQSDSRYTMSQDAPPAGDYDLSNLKDAVPSREPYSRGGNRSPYTVWGKSYRVLDTSDGYEATGIASWYGAKFHGHKTSNGEVYDMYQMSAAHRSLPLPSFVQVTNLENNRRVIVRVNDRGPFHSERIIDLSYAAAKKLGYSDKGTARVRIAAITVLADGTWTVAGSESDSYAGSSPRPGQASPLQAADKAYVQVGAFRDPDSAAAFQSRVSAITSAPVLVIPSGGGDKVWHRVHVGPFDTRSGAEAERTKIQSRQMGDPIVVMRGSDS